MKKPLEDIRPIGPFIDMMLDKGFGGERMFHSASSDNIDSILENGLQGSRTGSRKTTEMLENLLEKYRPEDKYPSRLDAVFTFSDRGMAEAGRGDRVISFRTEESPCAGWGVIQTGELIGIATPFLEDDLPSEEEFEERFKESAKRFWKNDVHGPIHNAEDFRRLNDRTLGDLSEVYFPCDIPPDILILQD